MPVLSASNPSATTTGSYTEVACSPVVNLAKGVVIGQSQLLMNGKPQAGCSDTAQTWPLLKDFTACQPQIDLSGGTSTLTYKLYYNTGTGANVYVNDCQIDTLTTSQMTKVYSGCPYAVSGISVYQQFKYNYVNGSGQVTPYGSCAIDTSMPVPVSQTQAGCSPSYDLATGVQTPFFQNYYTDTSGKAVNIGACVAGTPVQMTKSYSGCPVVVGTSGTTANLGFQWVAPTTSGTLQTVGQCQTDTSPAGVVQTGRDYSGCAPVADFTAGTYTRSYMVSYTNPATGTTSNIGSCTPDSAQTLPMTKIYAGCPLVVDGNATPPNVVQQYKWSYLDNAGKTQMSSLCVPDLTAKVTLNKDYAACPLLPSSSGTVTAQFSYWYLDTQGVRQGIGQCQPDTANVQPMTRSYTGCPVVFDGTGIPRYQYKWSYVDNAGKSQTYGDCTTDSQPSGMVPVSKDYAACPVVISGTGATTLINQAYKQAYVSSTTAALVDFGQCITDPAMVVPIQKNYGICPAVVDTSLAIVNPSYQLFYVDAKGGVVNVGSCVTDTAQNLAVSKSYLGCPDVIDNVAKTANPAYTTYWVNVNTTPPTTVPVGTTCVKDSSQTFPVTETATGCNINANLTKGTAVQQTRWVYTDRNNKLQVVDDCADSESATVMPIIQTSCAPVIEVAKMLANEMVSSTYITPDGLTHVAQGCTATGVTWPLARGYNACKQIVVNNEVIPQFKYYYSTDSGSDVGSDVNWVGDCMADTSKSSVMSTTGYGCEGQFVNDIPNLTSYGETRGWYVDQVTGEVVYASACNADMSIRYEEELTIVGWKNDDTTLSSKPLQLVSINAPVRIPAPSATGSSSATGTATAKYVLNTPQVIDGAPTVNYILVSSSAVADTSQAPTTIACNQYNPTIIQKVWTRPDGTTYTQNTTTAGTPIGPTNICAILTCKSSSGSASIITNHGSGTATSLVADMAILSSNGQWDNPAHYCGRSDTQVVCGGTLAPGASCSVSGTWCWWDGQEWDTVFGVAGKNTAGYAVCSH